MILQFLHDHGDIKNAILAIVSGTPAYLQALESLTAIALVKAIIAPILVGAVLKVMDFGWQEFNKRREAKKK